MRREVCSLNIRSESSNVTAVEIKILVELTLDVKPVSDRYRGYPSLCSSCRTRLNLIFGCVCTFCAHYVPHLLGFHWILLHGGLGRSDAALFIYMPVNSQRVM